MGEDDALEAFAARYREEKPSISDAVKNWCSYLAASELVVPEDKPHDMAHLLCKKNTLSRIYDGVAVPALRHTEHARRHRGEAVRASRPALQRSVGPPHPNQVQRVC